MHDLDRLPPQSCKTWCMGTLDSVTCTSAIFAWWKVRGSNFAEPLTGGVFGLGALRRVWYVTRTACLTRILLPGPLRQSRSAQGSPHRNVGVGERHGRPSRSKTRSAAQGDIGRHLRGLGELGGAGHVKQGWQDT